MTWVVITHICCKDFMDASAGVFHGGWVKEGDAVDEKEKVL